MAIPRCALKVGDMVELNSGGIPMTIESIDNGVANCVWMGKELVRRGSFGLECLRHAQTTKADFTLLIPGVNITQEDADAWTGKVDGHA